MSRSRQKSRERRGVKLILKLELVKKISKFQNWTK